MADRKDDPIYFSSRAAERQKLIDYVSRQLSMGSMSEGLVNTLVGFNHRVGANTAPINKDTYGFTFFTRPRLNLSYHNLASLRQLTPMLDENEFSMWRFIRATLDPEGSNTYCKTRLAPPNNPFIPVLSNNLLSLSGWPDITVDTYTSPEGLYKESFSMVDGVARNFTTLDLTANFRNMAGDPITLMMMVWVLYESAVYEGLMVPRPRYVTENRIDYNTRIYRLVMDQTNRYVQKVAACGAAFPMATPLGAAFNFNRDRYFNFDNEQVSIPFRCMGVEYIDPVILYEFNALVAIYNKGMDNKSTRKQNYTQIEGSHLSENNYYGLPWIDLDTMELQWWIPNNTKADFDL